MLALVRLIPWQAPTNGAWFPSSESPRFSRGGKPIFRCVCLLASGRVPGVFFGQGRSKFRIIARATLKAWIGVEVGLNGWYMDYHPPRKLQHDKLENPPWMKNEDVFPIENWGNFHCHVCFRGGVLPGSLTKLKPPEKFAKQAPKKRIKVRLWATVNWDNRRTGIKI